MSSAIESKIHQQGFSVNLRNKVPMKLGIAYRSHVRNVDVTHASFGSLRDSLGSLSHPMPITQL
jgi:hypothetical protein